MSTTTRWRVISRSNEKYVERVTSRRAIVACRSFRPVLIQAHLSDFSRRFSLSSSPSVFLFSFLLLPVPIRDASPWHTIKDLRAHSYGITRQFSQSHPDTIHAHPWRDTWRSLQTVYQVSLILISHRDAEGRAQNTHQHYWPACVLSPRILISSMIVPDLNVSLFLSFSLCRANGSR